MNFTIDYASWKMFLCFVEQMLLITFFCVAKCLLITKLTAKINIFYWAGTVIFCNFINENYY